MSGDEIIWAGQDPQQNNQRIKIGGVSGNRSDIEVMASAAEQRGFIHRPNNNNPNNTDDPVFENNLVKFVYNFIMFSACIQAPLIIIVPTLQLIMLSNANKCDGDLENLLSMTETIGLYLVPLFWWLYVWFLVFSIQNKFRFWSYYDVTNDNAGCNCKCLRMYIVTLFASVALLGSFILQFLLVFHSFVVWTDQNIICNDGTFKSMKSGLFFLTLIWLIDNICIVLVLFCCVCANTS